ncbi:TIGR03083 family protein [Micromonospora viridifaciens]|uniref:TIGR03083 family protein n=1 Tax=Micromonospora viridifaciens TaxID=1881 RepID=A0A1C4YDG3_MICVI|nr:TIGR03083 family protein [Micromonospora viridifaciens]
MDVMDMIADERRRVADLIAALSPEQLATPSLCGDWTVKQVAGHLVASIAAPRRLLLPLILRSGFNVHRANARLARLVARRSVDDLAAALRDNAQNAFRPPIVGYPGQLTDLQVHGQDIRRPLGLPHQLRPERLRMSLNFLIGSRAVGFVPRGRRVGLRFEATDLDWAWGGGPVVQGTAEAVMLALAGRPVVLAELHGDGVKVFRDRLMH